MDPTAPLLQPFVDQSASIRSIVAFGLQQPFPPAGKGTPRVSADKSAASLLRMPENGAGRQGGAWDGVPLFADGARTKEPPALGDLAAAALALLGDAAPGTDLLLLPGESLLEMMPQVADEFPFRAVIALWTPTPRDRNSADTWKLQRSLFDRGLVCIATVSFAGYAARCFLASDAIRSLSRLGSGSRGRVTMATLAENGRFANQLFRYSYVRLYALRHGLTAAFPAWEGREFFGLDDPFCARPTLETLSFAGFTDDDFRLWEQEDPPADIDLVGYFQETPACWQHQRPLLRRLFQLPVERVQAIDAWHHRATDGGRRTLVAIHIRRGDYRRLQIDLPWLRLVPEAWYLEWLRALWPTLSDPLLYVATDEPEVITPVFREFETVRAAFGPPADALPDHVRDFEVLRRADHLAICNSSYGRMAAILAPSNQKCYLPSFQTQSFLPYEPWIDPAFWARFRDAWQSSNRVGKAPRRTVETDAGSGVLDGSEPAVPILFDVSDLVAYLIDHGTLSGIQRVQCEILRNLTEIARYRSIRLVVLDHDGKLRVVETSALLDILDDIGSGVSARADVVSRLRALLGRAVPCTVQPRDIFLAVGAFWPVQGMGRLLQDLKNAGAIVGVLIHDLLPIDAPEYFDARTTRLFVKGVIETLTFADFIFTTSEYNKASITRLTAAREFDRVPIHLLPLAHERANAAPSGSNVSQAVKDILELDYVLCVGTIEVRKNPIYLFHLWKMMVQSGRSNIPCLVLAGRRGWLVRDFMDQLAACNYLDGRIVMIHDATDVELDLLYRNCRLTMFPSFVEGWGLPVGESLAHGKVCLCSATGGTPDAGGTAADYIDPYSVRDGLERLTRYLDNPELLHRREREIVDQFAPRSWRTVAEDFLRTTAALARQVRPADGTAAMRLPAGQYLPISYDGAAVLADGIDGALSAELACASGWRPAEISGARAVGREATLRFRAAAPVGAGIVLVMRLAAYGRACHIRIRSGSGAETEASLVVGPERAVVLSCAVEAGNLVTAHLSSTDANPLRGVWPDSRHWVLKGILYFEPQRPTVAAAQQTERPQRGPRQERILLSSAVSMDASRRATSLAEFLRSADSWWPSGCTTRFNPPIFADDADRRTFVADRAKASDANLVRRDDVKLIRKSNVFVSMARFSEGSVFDRSGVWRAMGYLQSAPRDSASWLSAEPEGVRIDAGAMAAAPFHDASLLVFYNGNLHNYYHWLTEGLLCLDVLTQAMGPGSKLRIALPTSMDIAAVFDHRRTLETVGLGGRHVVEVAADLIRAREAIWVDSDLVQTMPPQHLKDFRRRIAARYASLRGPGTRRLLVARRGPTRTIANLAEVQALLSGYDFETVYLEGMSMADQIVLFQGAEFIISPHGAGLANLLFCERGTKVIEFMPAAEFRPFFWLISEKLELVHGVQFCPTSAGQGFQGELVVDVAKLHALIRAVVRSGRKAWPERLADDPHAGRPRVARRDKASGAS